LSTIDPPGNRGQDSTGSAIGSLVTAAKSASDAALEAGKSITTRVRGS